MENHISTRVNYKDLDQLPVVNLLIKVALNESGILTCSR